MNSAINLQFFLSHPNIFPSSLFVLFVSLQKALFLQKLLSHKINHRRCSLSQRTRTVSFTKELAPCLLIEVRLTIGDEEWSFENIGSTLNIGTQNFDLIGFLSCLNLLFYRTSWWFGGFEWFSIVLHHYLGLGFGFLFLFSLSVFSSVLNLFSIFSI